MPGASLSSNRTSPQQQLPLIIVFFFTLYVAAQFLGAGKVLSGLARRIERRLDTKALGSAEDIEAVAPAMKAQA